MSDRIDAMATEKQLQAPKGLAVIKYLYALIAVGYGAMIVFPSLHQQNYINVAIWGKEVTGLYAVLIQAVLVLFPLLLYLGFSKPTAAIWYAAFMYHVFFIGNSILGSISVLLPQSVIQPMVRMTGFTIYTPAAIESTTLPLSLKLFICFNLTLLLGIFIVFYLWQQKDYFMPKKMIEKL